MEIGFWWNGINKFVGQTNCAWLAYPPIEGVVPAGTAESERLSRSPDISWCLGITLLYQVLRPTHKLRKFSNWQVSYGLLNVSRMHINIFKARYLN